jgi:UDP-N-acetyl-2-amino-2-deoxyglucuronate dehydrogenase
MRNWNFGIIGTGMIADFHARAILSLTNARLVGFSGLNRQKTEDLADKYNCKAFMNYAEMLLSKDIDIVTIATPSGAHMEPTIAAASHRKHVICEKPMEISVERINKMIKAHEQAGTHLGGIFNYRFNDSIKHLKRAIENTRFGALTYASAQVPWWRSENYYKSSWRGTWKLDGGGALMNQSIHVVDILQYRIGPVQSLQAYIATLGHLIEVEDTAAVILKFKNNALGTIYGSTASFPGRFRRLEITGTKGTVIMVENSFTVWQFADEIETDREITERLGEIEGHGGVSDPKAISFEAHAKNISSFIDAIEANRPFEIDGIEARKAVGIIEAIYTSAKEDKPYYF